MDEDVKRTVFPEQILMIQYSQLTSFGNYTSRSWSADAQSAGL
jgi:hypothetical protein